jgi:3-hydroxy-9,10-secoandrosta-1,3,5(10)-triene-9,17-dione monooxygenase
MVFFLDPPRTTDTERELRADLVGRAAKLVPLFAANADQTERERLVLKENVTALEQAGLLSLTRPKRYGGLETDLRTFVEVTREIARGCGSTGWIASLYGACTWMTGLFPAQAQEDVWGENPGARVCGVATASGQAKKVDGGYLVAGRWGWASGSPHAHWAQLGVILTDATGAPSGQGTAMIPMPETKIEDTWHVAGMSGTASNTIVVDEVFVPEHRLLPAERPIRGPLPYPQEVLYRSAPVPVGAIVLLGPQLGLAQAALDLVIDKAPKRTVAYTYYKNQTEVPFIQLALGKAASLIDTAHLHAYNAAADIDEAAYRAISLDYDSRARIRMDVGRAVIAAREAVRELVTVHGASSFGQSNPLQRFWRDIEVSSRQAAINPELSAEVFGKSLLGIRGDSTPFV